MGKNLVEYNKDKRLALWATRIADCRNGDLTVRQWCKEHNVSVNTFYHWQHKVFDTILPSSPGIPAAAASISVGDIVEIPSTLMPTAGSQPLLTIQKADLHIEIFAGATPELVEAVCRGLSHV